MKSIAVPSKKNRRSRVTICLEERIVEHLDRQSFRIGVSRSRLLELILSGTVQFQPVLRECTNDQL